jgi:predicted nucleotidyltransferase
MGTRRRETASRPPPGAGAKSEPRPGDLPRRRRSGIVADVPDQQRVAAASALRAAGARFAFVHGSRAGGQPRPDSDLDVGAWWGESAPPAFEVEMPPGVDLLVLDGAPLEIVGRIALTGELLFDDDPVARVRWVGTTRKIYLDELPRIERSRREFLEAVRRGR